MKVVNLSQYQKIQQIDQKAGRYDESVLAASFAMSMLEVISQDQPKEAFIVCGNGFNGAVGLLLAHLLKTKTDIEVKVADFVHHYEKYQRIIENDQIEIIRDLRMVRDTIPGCQYIVDCIFGTELDEKVYYPFTYLIGWINDSKAFKLSCDIPSGMNIDNGLDYGCVIKADATVTMSVPKLGFYLYPGNVNAGNVIIAPSVMSKDAIDEVASPFKIHNDSQIKEKLPVRYKHSYKGSYGKVLLIAGCKQTAGACILCGKAIMRSGAGLLTIMSHKEVLPTINLTFPEAMTIEIDDYNIYYQLSQMDFNQYDQIVIGPGLGRYSDTEELLIKALNSNKPVVVDADGLFYLKKHLDLVRNRGQLTVITPHIGEYKRVFDYNEKTIIDDLLELNQIYPDLAIVLKGENTLVSYQGEMSINTTGNNALAKGGSGDVLAGITGGLLAQKNDIDSVIAAVYVHSLGADYWVKDHSEYSMLASDLVEMIDKALWELSKVEESEEL